MILPALTDPRPPAAAFSPSLHDHIAVRAYHKWLARGRGDGAALADWLAAETELGHGRRTPHWGGDLLGYEDRWRMLVETATDYISVIDRDGVLRFMNHPAPGVRLADVVGTNACDHMPAEQHGMFRDALERVFRTGQPTSFEVAITLPRVGEVHWYSTRMGPIRVGGEVVATACISTDITERKWAERRLTTVHAVSRILAESADIGDAAPRIVQAICELLRWDVGALWLLDPHAGVLRCIDVWHDPLVPVPAFEQMTRELPLTRGRGLPGRIWASQRPCWIRDITRDGNSPRAAVASGEGLRAACGFPILGGSAFLGAMEFFSRDIQEPDERLLEMMGSIAGEIAQFVERRAAERQVREREKEFALARQIQDALLPKTMPAVPGFAFAGACRFVHETGGDYFDFIPLADGSLGIALGDASGHGVPAALLMAQARASLHALAHTSADPATLLTFTNEFLTANMALDYFVTLLLARLDPAARTLEYSSAGHWPGYVLTASGEVKATLPSTNKPLGLEANTRFAGRPPLQLSAGDVVFLYSDGITEALATDGGFFGIQRALAVVREYQGGGPERMLQGLFAAVDAFRGDGRQLDDVTAVVVQVGG